MVMSTFKQYPNSDTFADDQLQAEGEDPLWGEAVFADKGLFLLMLYDKAIKSMNEALELMANGDMVAKGERLIRAQDIVLQLSDALDPSTGEIADNLERLYLYIYRRLIRGNIRPRRPPDTVRASLNLGPARGVPGPTGRTGGPPLVSLE